MKLNNCEKLIFFRKRMLMNSAEFAREVLHVSPSVLSNIEHGMLPSRRLRELIEEVTDGEISADGWGQE